MNRRLIHGLAAAIAGLLSTYTPIAAQAAVPAAARASLTRLELESMLSRATETALAASADPVREQARTEVTLIRSRLAVGDLRAGDQIVLMVTGLPQLTDTFTVSAGRSVTLPGVGEIAVAGVLRSELVDLLARHVAMGAAELRVEAGVLIELEVQGAVQRPGRYQVPAEMPAADALSVAGGTTDPNAEGTRILRGDEVIWEGHALRSAELMGLSLDQLSLVAGDRIDVPGGDGRLGGLLARGALTVGAVASFLAVLIQMRVF